MHDIRLTRALMPLAFAAGILFSPETAAAQSRIEDLKWIEDSGTYVLRDSNGAVRIGAGMALLLGDQARRAEYLSEGVEAPATEAILYDIDNEVTVYFEFFPTGYVNDEDWKTIDTDQMMKEIVKATKAANSDRTRHGNSALRVTGWVSEPFYDQRRSSISMSISLESGRDKAVNASVLKLGRYGYEKITWVGTADQYGWSDRLLQTVVENHAFDPGYRYSDFQEGDAKAGYGLTGLVSAVAMSKSPQAAFAIMRLLRKVWYLVLGALAMLAAGGRWLFFSSR